MGRKSADNDIVLLKPATLNFLTNVDSIRQSYHIAMSARVHSAKGSVIVHPCAWTEPRSADKGIIPAVPILISRITSEPIQAKE